ncbi:ParB/RepB/Spo0J family partition protein [Merdibacter massiliensis]|uniref:ParB/RepB/Spo0J family partition protein n=1 Tax=Merdibacter massiliensis TaxID=1871030 RepID=UPI00096A4E23|nr:ParB/RepB/Spo0J family partition protein [Merdibacter massiliensis]
MGKSILGDFLNFDAKKVAFDNQIVNIHYTKIRRPNKNRKLRRIEELAEDIREDGLENNLLVREIEDEQYEVELIGGERRYSAILYNIEHGDLTYEYIPCKKVRLSDLDARRRLILNNHENDPLTAAEKLEAVEELREIYRAKKAAGEKIPGRIQELIADEMGIKKSQVANYEKVLNHATEEVREKIRDDAISIDAAAALVDLSEEDQNEFLETAETFSRKEVDVFKDTVMKQQYFNEDDELVVEEDPIEIEDEYEDMQNEEQQEQELRIMLVKRAVNEVKKLSKRLENMQFVEDQKAVEIAIKQLLSLFELWNIE